jgi:hypothetical protein
MGGNVSPIVIEQITLNVRFSSPNEIREFVGPEIGIISFNTGIVSHLAGSCDSQ